MRCEKCGVECGGNLKADEEYIENFGCYATEARGVLCDDCYTLFWQWAKIHAPELTRKR